MFLNQLYIVFSLKKKKITFLIVFCYPYFNQFSDALELKKIVRAKMTINHRITIAESQKRRNAVRVGKNLKII